MARYGTLKKNIRHNIESWDKVDPAPPQVVRAAASKVIAVFLALSLAGSLIPLVTNIVFRIPDLYQFDLGRTKLLAEIDELDVDTKEEKGEAEKGKGKEETVADAISSFMRHKTDNLQPESSAGGYSTSFFTGNDSAVMKTLRSFLDNILVIGFTSLALFVALYIILIGWNRPRELKRGFMGGVIIYAAVVGVTALGIVFKGPLMKIWEDVIGGGFVPTDRMPQIFHSGFFLLAWGAVTFITFVIILILFSLTHRVTRDVKMF